MTQSAYQSIPFCPITRMAEEPTPMQSFMKLAQEYGPIFQLAAPGSKQIIISSFKLVDEVSDDARFNKYLGGGLRNLRQLTGDGLFTAFTNEPNWGKAHRILMPNFSQKAMQGYFPMMLDLAEQLIDKWKRLNGDDEIDVVNDMTRVTLDTIGLCGFDYRFNSFYRQEMHPFVQSMIRLLSETQQHQFGSASPDASTPQQLRDDVNFMNTMVDGIIAERKARAASDVETPDLLSYMLTGIDKQTSETLDDVNIRYQIITFLIAGHETTSGLLSFALAYLLLHPEVATKAYAEVDRVLGNDLTRKPTYEQVMHLKYVGQILKETLRLWPTAPAFTRASYQDTTIGGKYRVAKDDAIMTIIPLLHRDPTIWGEHAEVFDPEHFRPEVEQDRPANAYKPFGTGPRACIGRQFALQEATLLLGMILQHFKLIDHRHYTFKLKQTLTLKPGELYIQVRPRTDNERTSVPVQGADQPVQHMPTMQKTMVAPEESTATRHHTPLLVLFGSNTGTSEGIAQQIAEDGTAKGFAVKLEPLDSSTQTLPKDGAVVIVTSSYNGTPPDNAVQFCQKLTSSEIASSALKGVRYTVMGCGNRDWASTFQKIPRLIDSTLETYGATRIYPRGEADASDDFDGQFQAWYQPLWGALDQTFALEVNTSAMATQGALYELEIVSRQRANPYVASFGAQPMLVMQNRELHNKAGLHPSPRSARHIEVKLPEGVSYRTGDHLGVIAYNQSTLVERVTARFNLDPATLVQLHARDDRKTALPVDVPIIVFNLLSAYVELQDVATRKQIKTLAQYTACPPEKQQLEQLSGEDEASNARYKAEVLAKRKSLIDLLEEFPSCELPFYLYLEMLPAIRPRYYSISSSPLQEPDRCSITVGEVNAPARSGHGIYRGMCSSYLCHQDDGSVTYAFTRDNQSAFRLPSDSSLPLIMVGPGTGLAPFRGFLQERAVLQARGEKVGPSLFFFGCRNPQQDFIYEQELQTFVQQGLTELHVAFSRADDRPKMYVQESILQNKEQVWQLIQNGAAIYVCGEASTMAPGVKQAFLSIYQEKTGKNAQEAEDWYREMVAQGRYLVDVWAAA